MIKKKKWIIIAVLAAVIVVAVGVVGGVVYANSNSTAAAAQTDPQKVLADKVAAILGVDAAKVEAAFTQAQKEMASERSAEMLKAEEARIDQAVTDGKMTADEAAKLKTWLESKPDVTIPGIGDNGGFRGGRCGPGGMRGFNRGLPPADTGSTAAPAPTTN